LRRTFKFSAVKYIPFLLFALIVIATGCSLEKESGFNRSMQNLTAHYNILFNANEILRQKQESYATSFIDNYNEILSVYQDTTTQSTTPDKDLEAATAKANNIINIKEQSHYIGDAYLVLGKANFLEANYYNAVEYFNYVIRTFPKRKDLVDAAHVWKTRTLIYLDQLPQAKLVIDTAIQDINPKKKPLADIYATKLVYDIAAQDYADGEDMAKKAIQYCHDQSQRMRWTFILGQLQELNKEDAEALKNYSRIAKSNALFEMAFNASLNIIRIEDNQNGIKINRTARLMSLLKNPNNLEFKDQIYYQVAQLLYVDKNIDGAIKNYNLSVRSTVKNQSQKGLSYLRLAQIYFNDKADYVKSKKYYDSTLTSLPVNFPGYQGIQKMSVNLALLADRLQIIAREDTLQALAKMDEKQRDAVIDKMVSDYTLQQQAIANAAKVSASTSSGGPSSGSFGGGSFYFDNAGAVGQGYTDFKKVWGNRKLEDDWRRSQKSASNVTANSAPSGQGNDPDAPIANAKNGKTLSAAATYRQNLVQGLPLTPELLTQSNLRLYNAYTDIADFYRDILGDNKQAIAIFELMLSRFPDDPNRPAIYYSLYRLYSDIDAAKSDFYKNKLLKEYPETPFAKIITDPGFIKKLEDKDIEFTNAYNAIFDLYANKKYKDVIQGVPELMKQNPGNKYSAQLYYLQTIAQGHNEKVGPFTDSLKQLLVYYPNDKLIVPLVKAHLAYINANQTELVARNVVLPDVDPQDVPFTLAQENKKQATYRKKLKPLTAADLADMAGTTKKKTVVAQPPVQPPKVAQPPVQPPKAAEPAKPVNADIANQTLTAKQSSSVDANAPALPGNQPLSLQLSNLQAGGAQPTQPVNTVRADTALKTTSDTLAKTTIIVSSIFSKLDSTNYYFIVNVTSGTTNLASSRFGIGQFNRANYAGLGIRHELRAVGDSDQVIYVGRFSSLNAVKKYARAIVPLLTDIMKVPVDKYSFFIITKENLDKLADKKMLNSYIDYYQSNY
jgi:tetratricopeptide (TPR) repeat protein